MTAEQIKAAIEAAVPGCRVEILQNGSPSAQHSLVLDNEHAVEVARFLRDDAELRLDFCSNVTGVDWLDTEVSEKVKTKKLVEGVETEVEEIRKTQDSGTSGSGVSPLFHGEKAWAGHSAAADRPTARIRTQRSFVDSGVAQRGVSGARDF